jgi:hypothetical protein
MWETMNLNLPLLAFETPWAFLSLPAAVPAHKYLASTGPHPRSDA